MDHFQRAGLTFDVVDGGPPDGEPVVLLHGFPQAATCWERLAPLLHQAGYRTLALHQRGISPGARPRGRRAYRLPLLVGDVAALVHAAGHESAHVVGHDLGGMVAWSMAATRPEVVRTLTSLSTPHTAAFLRALVRSDQALRSWYMLGLQLPVLPERLLTRDRLVAQLEGSGLEPALARRDADRMAGPGVTAGAISWYRAIPLADPRGAGATVAVPTLYQWPDQDPFVRRAGAEASGRYVTGPYTFEVLEGVGHWVPEMAPERVAAALVPHMARARS